MTHEYKHKVKLHTYDHCSKCDGYMSSYVECCNCGHAADVDSLLDYARELEGRCASLELAVKELEIRDVSATHMIMDADFKKHEMSLRIADLERQLAEATNLNHRMNYELYGDQFLACLPETKKEDV